MYRSFYLKEEKSYRFVCEINVLKYEDYITNNIKFKPAWVNDQIWKVPTNVYHSNIYI